MQNTRTRRGSFQERDSDRYDSWRREGSRFGDDDNYNARRQDEDRGRRPDGYATYRDERERREGDRNREMRPYGDTGRPAGTNDWDRQYSRRRNGDMNTSRSNYNGGRSWERDNRDQFGRQQSNGGRGYDEQRWNDDNRSWPANGNRSNRGAQGNDYFNDQRSRSRDQGYNQTRRRGDEGGQIYSGPGDTFNDRGDWDDNEHQEHGRVSGLGFERRRRSFSNLTGNNAQGTPGTWGSGRNWR
jgi:hypothetical protein